MINEEYATLKGMTQKTPEQWMRQNVLLELINETKGFSKGVYKMSDANKDAAIQKDKDEAAKRKADYDKYKVSQKKIPGEKTYNPDCPSFGEE